MRPRKKRSIIESISTITAIYDSIKYPYDSFSIKNLSKEEEKKYIEEKKEMTSEVAYSISNHHSKMKKSDFNIDVLNPRYFTNGDLKLIEDLLSKGLTEEEIKIFVIRNFPLDVIKQYVDREEIIKKNRERSLYLKQKFNKNIRED